MEPDENPSILSRASITSHSVVAVGTQNDFAGAPDQVAIQLKLAGSFESAGGHQFSVGVESRDRPGSARTLMATFSFGDINSDQFTNGDCGTWDDLQTTYGLTCSAGGSPTETVQTAWSYAEARMFVVTNYDSETETAHWTADFTVTVRDETTDERVTCERYTIDMVRNPFGVTSTATTGPC